MEYNQAHCLTVFLPICVVRCVHHHQMIYEPGKRFVTSVCVQDSRMPRILTQYSPSPMRRRSAAARSTRSDCSRAWCTSAAAASPARRTTSWAHAPRAFFFPRRFPLTFLCCLALRDSTIGQVVGDSQTLFFPQRCYQLALSLYNVSWAQIWNLLSFCCLFRWSYFTDETLGRDWTIFAVSKLLLNTRAAFELITIMFEFFLRFLSLSAFVVAKKKIPFMWLCARV